MRILFLCLFLVSTSVMAAGNSCNGGQRHLNAGEPCIPETLFNYLYCLEKSGGGKIELRSNTSTSNSKGLEVTVSGKGSGVIIQGEGAVGVKQSDAGQAAKQLNETLDPTLASKCESLARLVEQGAPHPDKEPTRPYSSGQLVIRGTWLYDLDLGTQTDDRSRADIWWEQKTKTERSLVPMNGASFAVVGKRDFASLGREVLNQLAYSGNPIQADEVGRNLIPSGTVVAFRTKQGRYGKLMVNSYGYDLSIRWETLPEK